MIQTTKAFLDNHESVKHVGDAAAITVTLGTVMQFLPALAALFTIVWTGIRIYETKTVQKWMRRRRRK